MTIDMMTTCSCCECPACDARIDRWNDGALDGARGVAARRQDADYLSGHAEGSEMRKVRPVMIERPEGYYHQPIGTFDDAPGWMLTDEEIAMIPHRDGAIAPELCA